MSNRLLKADELQDIVQIAMIDAANNFGISFDEFLVDLRDEFNALMNEDVRE